MTEKRFQKRYIEKNNKVYDTFKEMFITDELNSDSLLNVLSHLNGLGEMIDTKIEQGRYCIMKYKELEEESGQLKQALVELKEIGDYQEGRIKELSDENEQLKKEVENNIASYKKCNRRVFDLIDKKIKEVDTIGAEVLKDLRRELMRNDY